MADAVIPDSFYFDGTHFPVQLDGSTLRPVFISQADWEDCCCGPDYDWEVGSDCLRCDGDMPKYVTAVVEGVTPCVGCWARTNRWYYQWINTAPVVNGTFHLLQIDGNPCSYRYKRSGPFDGYHYYYDEEDCSGGGAEFPILDIAWSFRVEYNAGTGIYNALFIISHPLASMFYAKHNFAGRPDCADAYERVFSPNEAACDYFPNTWSAYSGGTVTVSPGQN